MMRQLGSDARLILTAAVGIVLIAIVGVIFQPVPTPPALSVRGDDRDGAMALSLWLEALGYDVRQMVSDPLQLDGIDVFFVLNPVIDYTPGEIEYLAEWVRRGNTLIAAGAPDILNPLLDPYHLWLSYLPDDTTTHALTSPTLLNPPVSTVQTEAIYTVNISQRPDAVVHLAEAADPVLVSLQEGAGTLWAAGGLRPFSNRGLSDPQSARLLVNLLAALPPGAVIAFDEAKHGFAEQPQSIFAWLVSTAPGWGIVSGFVLTMTFLALRGRRFGQPVPLPENRLRRESVEYIEALANLYRRSGQRADILHHYRDQFRRRLSERYTVDPRLSDGELVRAVVFRDPSVDERLLRDLLERLSRGQVSEQELVEIVSAVDTYMRSHL